MSTHREKTAATLRFASADKSWASALAPKALRWLALLPEWTDSLATSCEFPAAGRIGTTIERAEEAMLCNVDRHQRLSGRETVRFWMPIEVRSWVFEDWEKEAGVDLEDEVREISAQILRARGKETSISKAILCWAELAQAELSSTPVTGDYLSEHVRRSLGAHDLTSAGEWLFAGDWLSQPLGAPMEMATNRARREISLYHLRDQDTAYLQRFLPRRDQLAELRAVADSETQWGTHFIGLSGVGKTMLMRFVTSRHPGNPFKRASRIDFDHIDPRIPLEHPARLLQELGEGFAINLESGTQETLFKTFLEAVREAESARAGVGSRTPGWVAAMPEFDHVITSFAAFLAELPQPVALVLDTCEELAKLHPPGGLPWSVDATFDILERVHQALGSIKVIVAGRRWVTPQYAELPREDPAPPEVAKAKDRDFLRFHEVRGFSEEEVREYLRNIRHLELDEEIVAAILTSTSDPAAVPGHKGNDVAAGEDDFHSPNDLAFIANYLEEDRELGRKALEEGNFDSYVEKRILERAPEIQRAFPAATVLGHFDAATIEPVLGSDPETRRRLLARLIAEDWTHLEGGPEAEKIVVKVDRGLLRRLGAFYTRTRKRKRELEAARKTLQQHLAAKLDEAPVGATVEVVDAAVRLLPPEQMVAKLEGAAERAVDLGAWDWADAVTQRLLSDDLEPPLDDSLRGTVTALYLATIRHSGGTKDGGQLWDAVAAMAPAHPDKKRGAALRTRSHLAALAERAAAGDELNIKTSASLFWETCPVLGEEEGKTVVSALLAAAEGMIDTREEEGTAIPTAAIDACLGRLLGELEGQVELQAHIAALRGRLQALDHNPEQAAAAFSQVALVQPGPVTATPSFADWEAPASLVGRATLELLRFRLAMNEESEGLLDRCEAIAYRDGSVDCAQLLSLVLQARLASGKKLMRYQLEEAAEYEAELEAYELTAPTHRTAPPLFVSVAQGWMAIGMTGQGLKLLGERERLAASRRNDEDSTRAAALALLTGLRRLRLREGLALASHSVGSDEEMRTEALAAGVLIAGLQPSLNASRENDHAAWRARNLLEIQSPEALLPPPEDIEASINGGCEGLHYLLDVLESESIRQRWLQRQSETELATQVRERLSREVPRWSPRVRLSDPLGRKRLRVEVRGEALLDDFNLHLDDHRLGQVAEIALEEGEVMALRVPERAADLLQLAANCFAEIDDPQGAFVATLRAALAEIHAGRYEDARQRREGILAYYEELRLRHESLPALGALTTQEAGDLIGSDNPWRGWVWRLIYFLEWCDGRSDRSRAEAAIEFGPEFALRPAHGTLRPPGALRRGHRRPLRRRFPAVYRLLPLIPAVAVLVALAFGTTKLWALVAALVAVLCPAAVELVGPRLPRRVLPLSGFDLAFVSEPNQERGPSVRASAFVTVRPRASFWPMHLYLRALSRWSPSHLSVIPTGGYLAPRLRLPSQVQQALRPTLFGCQLPLKLEVDADLAPIAWERILLSGWARKQGWTPLGSPDIWRVRPIGFPTLAPQWKSEDIVTVCSPSWRGFLASSAAAKLRWVADPSVLGTWPQQRRAIEDEANSASRSRAAIALGTPVLTKAGWRLRLDEEELSAPLGDPSEPQLQQLVRPERLARRFSVVVVVGSPVGMSATSNGQLSRGLRGLANEIFLAGAHAVIAVPVLPLPLASRAVELVVGEIEHWQAPPDDKQLRNLARVLRDHIYRWKEPGDGEFNRQRQIELALDVCLFAPAEKGR
jgi:hypothetical protein